MSPTTKLVQDALKQKELTVLADRGYYSGAEISKCYESGAKALVPKNYTSGNKAAGLYDKADFTYDKENDIYTCPANEVLTRRFESTDRGVNVTCYYAAQQVCRDCKLKSKCTVGVTRRVRRTQYEDLLDTMAEDLKNVPEAVVLRASTVEHPYGTIKTWMGSQHFLMKRLKNVRTEMSLHVLAYNMKRMINILGVGPLVEAIRT